MKNTILASIIAFAFASSATAGDLSAVDSAVAISYDAAPLLGGEINVEVTENAAGDYIATTTFGVGINVEGVAFGGASIESVDGATFEIDEWQLGAHVGMTTLTFGKQGDLMVGNDFEIVGGTTIADVADDHESLIVDLGGAAVMVGFTDITSDVTEIENVQGSYSFGVASLDVTAVGDYNLNSEDWTVGTKANAGVGAVDLGAIVTYGSATEVFAYEASAQYNIVTAFVNGDDTDAFQNVGAGATYNWNSLTMYGEGSYNVDSEDTVVGAGVTFSF